jgi:hypothetical protein
MEFQPSGDANYAVNAEEARGGFITNSGANSRDETFHGETGIFCATAWDAEA